MRLADLGRWCFRHRRTVAVVWIAVVVYATAIAIESGGRFVNDFSLTGSEANEAFELLEERFPEASGDTIQVVVRADKGVADAGVQGRLDRLLGALGRSDHVRRVLEPGVVPNTVSDDGAVAIAQLQMDALGPDLPRGAVMALIDIADRHRGSGLQIELGGPSVQFAEAGFVGGTEVIGLGAAVVILLVTFGSVTAMTLPIVVAGLGLAAGLAGVVLLTNAVDIFTFATPLAAMIGLGVGIDYALFIVTRYRQGLAAGLAPEDAAAAAMGTAGRAVVFAGATVVISTLGMVLMRMSFANGLAYATALVVTSTVAAALTATPAALGFVGERIDSLRLPFRRARTTREAASGWRRWSGLVQRRPWSALAIGVAPLVLLATPVLSMRLGGPQLGSDDPSFTSRRAYDLVSDAFGPGANGPLLVVAELDDRTEPAEGIAAVQRTVDRAVELGARAGIPPISNAAGDTVVASIVPATAPHEEATERLVERLRDEIGGGGDAGARLRIGGVTALFIDMSTLVRERLPLFIGGVLLVSFVLLMAVFRSVLIPVKAVVANLLSIGAAYGLVVAVFQWGWLSEVIGVDRTGPIMAVLPMMLFAILFGLSMDYQVFLVSRIGERYRQLRHDNHEAVVEGLATSARVITAAALIMVCVFASFILNGNPTVKQFGVGMAVAIAVDATIVRCLLVPSAMMLIGRANWWMPAWLDRVLPRVGLETEDTLPPAPEPKPPAPAKAKA